MNVRPTAWTWKTWANSHLPPLHDQRFWFVQGLVAVIAGLHAYIDVAFPHLGTLYFVPVSLFFVPVVYAALNFGFAGSIATSLWATAMVLPNGFYWHSALEHSGELIQMVIVNAVAVFVGQRVDLESRARLEAERRGAALRASEARYRGLFETAGEAVLVIDSEGVIREANEAAGNVFRQNSESLRGIPVQDVLGEESLDGLVVAKNGRTFLKDVVLQQLDGKRAHLQPVASPFNDQEGSLLTQVILRDVTEQRWQEQGLRSYAAQILKAQEEERKRIAQELHDDTIQSLILVCRLLDEMEHMARPDSPPLIDRLQAARQSILDITDSLRRFTRGLRPPILDDLGLEPAVRRLAADLAEHTGMQVIFNTSGEGRRLSPDVELGLFRVAQEAIRNVERHAEASRITVNLYLGSTLTDLLVCDNGKGFRVPVPGEEGPGSGRHLGLLGMEERIRLLNGSLSVRSTPGKGTEIRASVPTACAVAKAPLSA